MRKLIAPFIALSLLAFAAPALAAPHDWPGGCQTNPEGNKQAARVYSGSSFGGIYDRECGNFWSLHLYNQMADYNFGNNQYRVGTIEGLNDDVGSTVLFNRSKNKGACFTFYHDTGYGGGTWNQRISFWVPKRNDSMKYWFLKIPNVQTRWYAHYWSSLLVWRPSVSSHDTLAECEADTEYQGNPRLEIQYGYKTTANTVVWYPPETH